MSLYGDSYINVNALKRWVNTLSLDAVRSVDVGGNTITIDGPVKEILELQLEGFSDFIYQLPDDGDWREFQGALSRLFYNAFFRVDNNAIRIANYYECLLVPSNMKTYKKIIRGYDYVDIGAIHITDINGNYIASIGQKSDLLWSTFFDYFMNEDEEGIHHVYSNHEQYLSIQLFDTESMTQEEITIFVNEILLSISSKYDMDFKIFELDPKYRELGNNTIYNMVYSPVGFEQIPVIYMNSAINSQDERLSYLSFYQVMEFFFVRAQNAKFLDDYAIIDKQPVDHNALRKVLSQYKKSTAERESLRLVLQKAVDIGDFRLWLCSDGNNYETYCNSSELCIDIHKEDKKIISAIVERVYSYRCSIAHAKGDVEEYIAIPSLSKLRIRAELPLMKYLAFQVLKNWS